MGTTLESIHIPGGDAEQIKSLMPKAAVGVWSERFVSVFFKNNDEIGGKMARRLSKKVNQPVLDAAIYDSDAVEFAVYQGGKRLAHHLFAPGLESKMGNVLKFCELLALEPEDAKRLRTIWSKADAQTQMELTANLLGTPLEYAADVLPEQTVCRDIRKVDRWIAELPKPLKIKSATTAELIQELEHFRLTVNGKDMVRSPLFYMSDEPWFMDGVHLKTVLWKIQEDGMLAVVGEIGERLDYREEQGRLIGIAMGKGVRLDSEGTLPGDFADVPWFHILDHGRILIPQGNRSDHLLTCCDPEGARLWVHYRDANYLGCGDEKVLLYECIEQKSGTVSIVKSLDARTGKVLGRLVLDTNMVYYHGFRDGIWWVSCFEDTDNGLRDWLLKLDENGTLLDRLAVEDDIQEIDFSPDGKLVYLYFYQKKVQVICTDTLAMVGEFQDRTLRIPCGTDCRGRVWMRCANSTMEARDREMGKILARHKLVGTIVGTYFDGDGNLCATAWDKKKAVLRIYRIVEK